MVVHDDKSGLAGTNYQSLFQDSKGILWVGTYGSGLGRYDGKHWENWSQSTGLFNNNISNIFEDREGGIWLDHTVHGVSRWKDGKMQSFDFKQDTCAKGALFYEQKTGKVSIVEGFQFEGIPSTRIFEYDYKKKRFVDTHKKVIEEGVIKGYTYFNAVRGTGKNEWWATATYSERRLPEQYHIINGNAELIKVPNYDKQAEKIKINPNPAFNKPNYQNRQGFFLLENNQWKALSAPKFPHTNKNKPQPNLQFTSSSYDAQSNSFFIVWALSGNVQDSRYLLAEYDPATMNPRQTIMLGSSVSFNSAGDGGRHVRKDAAGTIWMANYNKVVRLFPDQLFIPASAPGMIEQVGGIAQASDGTVWFASNGNGLAGFDGFSLVSQPNGLSKKAIYITGGYADEAGNVYFSSTQPYTGIFKFDGHDHWENLAGGKDVLGYYITKDKKGQLLWGTSGKGLWILPKGKLGKDTSDWLKIDKSKGLELDNVLTTFEDRHGRYWMGRLSQGIAMYDPKRGKVVNWMRTQGNKNFGCVSMAEDTRGNLWFGTDRGLCFFENKATIGPDFDLSTALQLVGTDLTGSSAVMSCMLSDANTLLLGNEAGFHTLDLAAFYEKEPRVIIRSFNTPNGYEAGAVGQNVFFIDSDSFLWMAGAKGVARFAPKALPKDTIAPQVLVDSLVAGGHVFTDYSKTIRLAVDERFVQIHFHSPPNPMLYDNVRFEYKLTGDSTWTPIPKADEMVSFPRLEPGAYQFEIRAVKEGLYSKPSVVEFRIPPVWWLNPWFWLAVLGVVIASGIYLRRKESKIHQQTLQIEKSKVQIESMGKEKNKLQVQAIVNQLNPHFINNALQWLQVRLDEDEEAVGVVGKLSENISTVFKNSRQKKAYHSLGHEVRLAENYLFIQKCRFRDKLEYEMPDGDTLRKLENVDVPLMIIQIHVENAVEHGIRNKMIGGGKVSIKLQDEPDYAVISIEDNGVGRAAAKIIGSKGTQNGTTMLKELETIYNLQNELPLTQQYEDDIFTDETGKPHGTRVVIRVPKTYNFEL